MTAHPDLDALLAQLDLATQDGRRAFDLETTASLCDDAAAALRALREDFLKFATRHEDPCARLRTSPMCPCSCGLKAARARWASKEKR